ncbi:MAG: TlpA disulfide reductase family protein, partial [Gammaproteobacteria bacterium]|nr:TlpA disulfide reductase family protein [Gammaproteobacteria bacterium]
GRSVLVHLWADWCQPCVKELAEFSREESRLRQQGIDVLALSVDVATQKPRSSPASESKLLAGIAYPFRAGRADQATVEKLQLLHDTLFELRSPLPIPTSFLIDRQGRVTAVYKGVVTVDQLLADKQRLAVKTTQEWRMATMVFPGRWIMPPRRRHLFNFVSSLADRGYREDCARYVGWNKRMLTSHPAWQQLSERIQTGLRNSTGSD